MDGLALSSLRAARIGIDGWVGLIAFFVVFFVALRVFDDPGDDWPPYVWLTPLFCSFVVALAMSAGFHGWRSWLLAGVLSAMAAWITTGPWLHFETWRRPALVLVTPLLQVMSEGIGLLAGRWVPELLLK